MSTKLEAELRNTAKHADLGEVSGDMLIEAADTIAALSRSTAGDEWPPREPTDAMVDAAELKMPGLGRLQIRFLYETMVAAAANQSTGKET